MTKTRLHNQTHSPAKTPMATTNTKGAPTPTLRLTPVPVDWLDPEPDPEDEPEPVLEPVTFDALDVVELAPGTGPAGTVDALWVVMYCAKVGKV